MSQFFETPCRPDTAAGALGQYLRVKTPGALALAGASDVAYGTMEIAATAAGPATVRLRNAQGTKKMVAVDAITAGDVVYAASSGKISASGTVIEGRALETSTTDGDIIEVMPLGASTVDAGTVTESGTQTLTNKTLTSPVVNTPTVKDLTEVVTSTNVIAATETGTTFFLNSATEFVSTLPAPAAGLTFRFIVKAAPSGASYTIVTNSSANIILGHIVCSAGGTGDSETSGGDTISFVDGQAVVGDMVDLFCDGTNWFARGTCKVVAGMTITTAS